MFNQSHTAYGLYHTISRHWLLMPSGVDTQTHTQTQTHRHTHRHTQTHTNTHTYRCANQSNFKKPDTHGLRPCTWFNKHKVVCILIDIHNYIFVQCYIYENHNTVLAFTQETCFSAFWSSKIDQATKILA